MTAVTGGTTRIETGIMIGIVETGGTIVTVETGTMDGRPGLTDTTSRNPAEKQTPFRSEGRQGKIAVPRVSAFVVLLRDTVMDESLFVMICLNGGGMSGTKIAMLGMVMIGGGTVETQVLEENRDTEVGIRDDLCHGIMFCSFDGSMVTFEKSTIVCNRR